MGFRENKRWGLVPEPTRVSSTFSVLGRRGEQKGSVIVMREGKEGENEKEGRRDRREKAEKERGRRERTWSRVH